MVVQQRWVFAFLCFLGTLHAFALRNCLSITLVGMVFPLEQKVPQYDSCPSVILTENNSTNHVLYYSRDRFEWSGPTQGLIFSSFYYSYIFSHIPSGHLANRYGGKHLVGLGVSLSALLTLLIPLSIDLADSTGLITVRILTGLCEGLVHPAIIAMVPRWTPFEERARIVTLIYSGEPLGTIYANMVGGLILYYFEDWRYVFYLIGGTGVLWYGLWLGLCYNSPKDHPFISDSEKNYLEERLKDVHEDSKVIPWKHILRSVPVWAAIIAMMGFDFSHLTVITYLPKYLSSVLKFNVKQIGSLISLVSICMMTASTIIAWFSDFIVGKKTLISATNARKLGSVIALFSSACFFAGASYAGCDRILVMIFFGVAMSLMGAGYPCILINAVDLSPTYAGILMALNNGISVSFTGIMAPYVIGSLTPNQTLSEWRLVFWLLFAVMVSTNLVFLMFGSADVQYWNKAGSHLLDPLTLTQSSNVMGMESHRMTPDWNKRKARIYSLRST